MFFLFFESRGVEGVPFGFLMGVDICGVCLMGVERGVPNFLGVESV